MDTRTYPIFFWAALFMLIVFAVPGLADMGNSRQSGGMGSEKGSGGIQSTPGSQDPQTIKRKSSTRKVPFETMRRVTTGAMADGGVKMELEPYSFEGGVFRVKFYANTHTVNLGDYDMMKLMHLEYEDVGYKPVSVDRMRGHHAGGEIEFRVPYVPEHFRIILRGLPTINERVFEW